jgi:hypothetical protein
MQERELPHPGAFLFRPGLAFLLDVGTVMGLTSDQLVLSEIDSRHGGQFTATTCRPEKGI